MARTPPKLEDAHPALVRALLDISTEYADRYRDRALRLVWVNRSIAEQQRAYSKGHSRLDGITGFSRHNFLPALALDVWVYAVEEQPESGLFHSDDPALKEATLILRSGNLGLSGREVWAEYEKYGEIAERTKGINQSVFWGGNWATIKDGPHIEMGSRDRIWELQRLLESAGFDPGPVDGLWGPKTKKAYYAASQDSCGSKKRSRGSWICHPDVWSWLWRRDVGDDSEVA